VGQNFRKQVEDNRDSEERATQHAPPEAVPTDCDLDAPHSHTKNREEDADVRHR
jgi:hypothetical protein